MYSRILLSLLLTALSISVPPAHAQNVVAASPLARYPGFGHNARRDELQYRREHSSREQLISRCMQAAGFRYTPVAPVVQIPQDRERGQSRTVTEAIDPNERYARTLDGAERTVYNLTLYGVPDPNDPRAGALWNPRSSTGGGCWGEALRALPGVYAARSALASVYVELRRSIQGDERVTAAEQRWGDCMRDRGFRYSSPRELSSSQDTDAVLSTLTPELQRLYRAALAASPACITESRLQLAVIAVRSEREAEFVLVHKALLDQHLERLRR